uniref:DUF6074 family protein n=1 Tax=Stappia sp. TaxID=1870903 RepID=UPI003BA861D4
MTTDSLPLLDWQRPRQVIPFPGRHRTGHAARVANSLSNSASQKDADWRLSRAVDAMRNQMAKAGVHSDQIEREVRSFLILVNHECTRIGSSWSPVIECQQNQPDGAA